MLLSTEFESANYGKNCSSEYSPHLENFKYLIQFFYLFCTLCLLIYFMIVLHIQHKEIYRNNISFWIFSADSFVTIIQIFLDISAVRLFLYVPQLCPTFSKIFINYKFLNHIIFPIYNYCRVFKAVSQSAHILVRYSCVTNILTHEQKTSKKIPLVMGIIGFLPILVIWNTVISEKEVVFWYGGFFTVYHRYVQWASLSFLHLIFLLVAITIILLTSLLIYRELDEHQVMNSIQKSLIINTGFVTFALILQAIFQSYYALFRHYSWFPMYFIDFQFLIYDVMTVGCPIMMLIFAQNFRAHTMFGPRSKATNASQHYPFQPFSEAIRKKTDDPPRPCNALIFSGIPE